jgi:hypothetical protein
MTAEQETEVRLSGWWAISFADPGRPEGEQFLGLVVVPGPSFESAILRSHIMGVNPGGEAAGIAILDGRLPTESWRNRLLSKAEALELQAWGERRWGPQA